MKKEESYIKINIRMATVNDVEKLIKARFDYFDTENFEITSEQYTVIGSNLRQYFTKHLNNDFFAAIVEENNQIVSLAFLTISEKPANPFFITGKTGTFFNVFTYPKFRKRGYATHTLITLIEEAKRQNLSFIELSASESGKSLYQKLGFQDKKSTRFTDMKLSLL